ncbi:UvrD-helicase domain-containing protein [Bacteroidota bacterium]
MNFFGDFHLHSYYSRATSKNLNPEYLDFWSRIKGITLTGTGDFTHPDWVKELKQKLEPAEEGLFKLKEDFRITDPSLNINYEKPVRFLLSAELSNIYKKKDRIRKIHNIIFAPDFDTVDKIQKKLVKNHFNIRSDGRPILGLDAKILLEILLEINEDIFFIPAHIWTPWFSVLGAQSGFNSIEECFEELTPAIKAVETGLSSDPPMNWTCSFLDNFTLISNSDAHSPEKLGRNANSFDTELTYPSIIDAISTANPEVFKGTIDLYPQEGKYHYAGHRKCNVCLNPVETLKNKKMCPKCGKPLTLGVMNRVLELSDRSNLEERKNKVPFQYIIPLKELISEILQTGNTSKLVSKKYEELINIYGSELDFLLNTSISDIEEKSGEIYAEAISRMRNRKVIVKEGYDGNFGVIKVFNAGEIRDFTSQSRLFESSEPTAPEKRELLDLNLTEYQHLISLNEAAESKQMQYTKQDQTHFMDILNIDQKRAVQHSRGPAMILAGPGTGKTRVLTLRIANLILNTAVSPEHILAVTFTNKASNEIYERLKQFLEIEKAASIKVSTFHSLGFEILKSHIHETDRNSNFLIIDNEDVNQIIKSLFKEKASSIAKKIKDYKIKPTRENIGDKDVKKFEDYLKSINAFELDDLIYWPVRLLQQENIAKEYTTKYQRICVDEFQDINGMQYEFLKLLSGSNKNIFVIGDPNQAIYGFRGSDARYTEIFKNEFNPVQINLKQSYRCTNNILKASGNVLAMDEVDFIQGIDEDVKIEIVKNATDKSEAEFVARKIENMMGGFRFFSMDSGISKGHEEFGISSLSEIAVLARTKNQFKAIEKAFYDHSIPYRTFDENLLFEKPEIKFLLLCLKYFKNSGDSYLHQKLTKFGLSELDKQNILQLADKSLEEFGITLMQDYFPDFEKNESSYYDTFIDILASFKDNYTSFYDSISIRKNIDYLELNRESVPLLSLHSSKGLEFKCVFIIGCNEGLIPLKFHKNYEYDYQEEKRLLYVGMTRAEKYLFLSSSTSASLNDRIQKYEPSSFLKLIEKQLVERTEPVFRKQEETKDSQLDLFS